MRAGKKKPKGPAAYKKPIQARHLDSEFMWSIGVMPAPLELSHTDKREVRRVIHDARHWAKATEGRGPRTSVDATLPANAAKVILSWLPGVLRRVEAQAFSSERRTAHLSRAEREHLLKQITAQRRAIDAMPEGAAAACQSRRAFLQIKRGSRGVQELNADFMAALRVFDLMKGYLAWKSSELSRSARPRGRPVNAWQEALILNLGTMWYLHGWIPSGTFTTANDRRRTAIGPAGRPEAAFPGVLRVLLMAQARRAGRPLTTSELVSLRLNRHLRLLREHHDRGTLNTL